VACAGAQWEKAQELFELMRVQHCTPDVVTYTALISACQRGGKWGLALQARSPHKPSSASPRCTYPPAGSDQLSFASQARAAVQHSACSHKSHAMLM
jgi:hypothetical protein